LVNLGKSVEWIYRFRETTTTKQSLVVEYSFNPDALHPKHFYFEKIIFFVFALMRAAEVKTHIEREMRNTLSSQKISLLFKKIGNSSAKLPIT